MVPQNALVGKGYNCHHTSQRWIELTDTQAIQYDKSRTLECKNKKNVEYSQRICILFMTQKN